MFAIRVKQLLREGCIRSALDGESSIHLLLARSRSSSSVDQSRLLLKGGGGGGGGPFFLRKSEIQVREAARAIRRFHQAEEVAIATGVLFQEEGVR